MRLSCGATWMMVVRGFSPEGKAYLLRIESSQPLRRPSLLLAFPGSRIVGQGPCFRVSRTLRLGSVNHRTHR